MTHIHDQLAHDHNPSHYYTIRSIDPYNIKDFREDNHNYITSNMLPRVEVDSEYLAKY